MRNVKSTHATGAQTAAEQPGQPAKVTPELVRIVTDRVYALLLAERQIAQERQRGCLQPALLAEKRMLWR